ncbi:MAG: hypothetical protein RQ952_06800 [Thermoproteota archaeon]|nr:hypothetical protein [Thermoproteota archaeon]
MVISTIIIASFLSINYISQNYNYLNSKVIDSDIFNIKRVLIEIFNELYYTNSENYIKIINIGNNELKILNTNELNFTIILLNETLNWKIKLIEICFNCSQNYDIKDLYSLDNKLIKDKGSILLTTLNIKYNITYIDNIKIYNIYIMHQILNDTVILSKEYQIKINSYRNSIKIIRVFENETNINLNLNSYNIFSLKIDPKSIVIFNLITINVYIDYHRA